MIFPPGWSGESALAADEAGEAASGLITLGKTASTYLGSIAPPSSFRCRSRAFAICRLTCSLICWSVRADVGFLPIYSSSPSMARSRMICAAFTRAIADALLDSIICTSLPSASSPLTLLRLPGGRPLGLPL